MTDAELDKALRDWFDAPADGEGTTNGNTNGSKIATDPDWQTAKDNGEIEAYLATLAGLSELWGQVLGRARGVIAALLFVDWVADWWAHHGGGAG
jgi:hypothetical protein